VSRHDVHPGGQPDLREKPCWPVNSTLSDCCTYAKTLNVAKWPIQGIQNLAGFASDLVGDFSNGMPDSFEDGTSDRFFPYPAPHS